MKMSTLLWRILSAWLCVAVVCWYSSCYAGSSEVPQEAQRLPAPSQDGGAVEEPREEPQPHAIEEDLVLPAESAENEQVMDDNEDKEEEMLQDEAKQQQHAEHLSNHQTIETQEATVEGDQDADGETKAESDAALHLHETTDTTDQDQAALLPSSDMVSAPPDEIKEDSSIPDLPETVINSASGEVSDVTDASDLPPNDCEEEEHNPYNSDSSPPIVLENTSNVHTAGTKSHPDPPLSPPSSQSAPHVENSTSHAKKDQDSSSPVATDTDSSVSGKDPEDIPTFDEWKRKMMEVEKEKTLTTHTSSNGASHTVKKVQKNFNNYASVECGAKILGANPEAKSTSAILRENMDLYMLNPCSNKIWFVIELCEPILLKQLDIANFELFSSTPKDFLVSIGDRYPTNKWLKLGTFHARDERTVQSFPLDQHLYAKYVKMFTKYIKVELVSHFGSEHFCPLSLIRVFGTSMVEEYEEIADPSERTDDPDDDLDYPNGFAPGEDKLSNNLIGSAKDAILNMVNNIAVNVLGGGQEMQGNLSSQEVNMTEPSLQLQAGDQTDAKDLPSAPETEDIASTPDSDVPATTPPTSENSVTESPPAPDDEPEQLHPVEEHIVTPLEKEEEEPISSTIILLEEEELDEEKERAEQERRQQESVIYCALGPLLPPSCSCAASLAEFLQKCCSACLSRERSCQMAGEKPIVQIPSCQLPLPPSSGPDPQRPPGETHKPREQQQAAEPPPKSSAIAPEAPRPSENSSLSGLQPPLLEPSQASKLPKHTAAESSPAKATPAVKTPQLSSELQAPAPEPSRDPADEEMEPCLTSSVYGKPSVSHSSEDKMVIDVTPTDTNNAPVQTHDKTDQPPPPPPTASPQLEKDPDPPVLPETITATEVLNPFQDAATELDPSGGQAAVGESKTEDLAEDASASPSTSASAGGNDQPLHPPTPTPPSSAPPSPSDIYADPPNGTEQNGNAVHGSSQKESVFMRLNNRIKALEMNMSLSGRYLEQLSQRYRKQMEEMQKAFNKTIIKLQNTSRLAEEQDQRQTESIQTLQGQLENMTQLVLNLSVRVSQLQAEVSDRQNYLLLSLLLCLSLGLLLCAHHCRVAVSPAAEPEPPIPKSYTYCSPERQFSCDEAGLKRSASYPLIHSEAFQLANVDGPDVLHPEETSLCPGNRKRRRRKLKPLEKVETLKPSLHSAPELCNGAAVCNGVPVVTNPALLSKRLLQPSFRDSPSEGSSDGSSHSDDPSFCGITAACSRMCDGLPPPKTRAEKRALRRRRPKPSCAVVDLIHAPRRDKSQPLAISTIEDMLKRKTEASSGTFVALSGPV